MMRKTHDERLRQALEAKTQARLSASRATRSRDERVGAVRSALLYEDSGRSPYAEQAVQRGEGSAARLLDRSDRVAQLRFGSAASSGSPRPARKSALERREAQLARDLDQPRSSSARRAPRGTFRLEWFILCTIRPRN